MKTFYLAQMRWPEGETPVCIGTDRKKVLRKALKILHDKYGKGPVIRTAAIGFKSIGSDDIDIVEVPFV